MNRQRRRKLRRRERRWEKRHVAPWEALARAATLYGAAVHYSLMSALNTYEP